jgi:hypothetical protein
MLYNDGNEAVFAEKRQIPDESEAECLIVIGAAEGFTEAGSSRNQPLDADIST